jgi:hypothetical protein
MYITQVSLLLIGQQHLIDFFKPRPLNRPSSVNFCEVRVHYTEYLRASPFKKDQIPPKRPKARGLAQHGSLPGWLEER